MIRESGQVITFYSYKGGTGRTMALANTACLLTRKADAKRGVLMIDWDLEAPGLHRFFYPRRQHQTQPGNRIYLDDSFEHLPGLIDLFVAINEKLDQFAPENDIQTEQEARELIGSIDFGKYIWETERPGISLLKAGCFDSRYPLRVNTFDWETLYNRSPWLFRLLAEELSKRYDFVLIDSRTGITDTSGICTMIMPEKLVVVFVPNEQSIVGVIDLVENAVQYRIASDDLRALDIYPLPSRLEDEHPDLKNKWRFGELEENLVGYQVIFENLFRRLFQLKDCSLTSYFDNVQVQHVPYYAYGEKLAVLEERTEDRLSIAKSYKNFCDQLVYSVKPWDEIAEREDDTTPLGSAALSDAPQKSLRYPPTRLETSHQKLQAGTPTIVYTVFVASPGDVIEEREIAYRVINEVNENLRSIKESAGVRVILDPLSWEKDVFPNIGVPQETIKMQIPYERCDIFIGIFWKRFGTPPGTVSPQDGKPYISGTQQEIEEAMAHWTKEGSPVLVLYRKNEPVSSPLSREDADQLHKVANFFRECDAGGIHPALVIPFKNETFETTLRDHLFKLVNNLLQNNPGAKSHQTLPDTHFTKPGIHLNDLTPRLSNEIVDSLSTWLKEANLREHPFSSLFAESDTELLKYFARFKQIRALTKTEVFQDRNPWVFAGNLGTGKTALRKLLGSWGTPDVSQSDIFCLEFGRNDVQGILSEVDSMDDFAGRFLQVVYQRVVKRQQMYALPTPDWQPKGDLAGSLASLSRAVQDCGLQRVMCLIDPDAAPFEHKETNVASAYLIEQLLKFRSAPGGIGFCYFLPSKVKSQLNKVLSTPSKRFQVIQIQWTPDDLQGLISRRMTACSSNQAAPYRSLGELCDDERDFASLVDRKIVTLAEGSPRAVISLANHLIELHVQDVQQIQGAATPLRVSPRTWEEVEMNWWWQRRSTILPEPGFPLWVRSGHIFYGNYKLVLTDRSQRLLGSLVQDRGNFASKDELKLAGWPGVGSQDGISDAALREAIRRMKQELEAEFETNNLGEPPTIKSIRSRGYRLENVKPSSTGREVGDE